MDDAPAARHEPVVRVLSRKHPRRSCTNCDARLEVPDACIVTQKILTIDRHGCLCDSEMSGFVCPACDRKNLFNRFMLPFCEPTPVRDMDAPFGPPRYRYKEESWERTRASRN